MNYCWSAYVQDFQTCQITLKVSFQAINIIVKRHMSFNCIFTDLFKNSHQRSLNNKNLIEIYQFWK